MPLQPGARLGPYEITAQVGRGGMGEVYRATDTNLGRQVAIKVLPESVAQDPERLARFDREARTLASLNHPNIATIHGLERGNGTTALVMELVEGPTLADRIAQGPIPVDEALPIAKQIAEALEAAHEQGIIHRDLKPANIKLRRDGTVKVLDFGLAKLGEPPGVGRDFSPAGHAGSKDPAYVPGLSQSPTITTPAMTHAGTILGTAAYMSPEQARGKPVDRRADIWAFGAVLFEMLTGQPAFEGEDVSDTLANVLKGAPNWEGLPAGLSPTLSVYLKRCLHRDPKQRLGDIHDMRLALDGAFETGGSQVAEVPVVPRPALWRRALPVASAALLAAILVGLAAWSLTPEPVSRRVTRLTIAQPEGQSLFLGALVSVVAISPDGTHVAYRVQVDGEAALAVRALDRLEPGLFVSTPSAGVQPVFSPDGMSIGFYDGAGISRVAATGGPVRIVARLGLLPPAARGLTWGDGDTLVFGTSASSGLWQVPASGGVPEPFTTLDPARDELNHEWPSFLPGGEAVLFAVRRQGQADDASQVVVRDTASGTQRVLISGGTAPRYAASGHLIYAAAGTLWAVPFDIDSLTVAGEPVAVETNVRTNFSGVADYALAGDGTLFYVAGDVEGADAARSLVWVDRAGREEPVATPARSFETVSLSPDGTRAALGTSGSDANVWISDLARGTLTLLSVDAAYDGSPLWSLDGRRVAFASNRRGTMEVLWQAADASDEPATLVAFDDPLVSRVVPSGWSPDGVWLLVAIGSDTALDIGMVSVDDPTSWRYLLQTPAGERNPTVSPDGRWLAYSSNESGAYEVYVQRFPDGGARQQVSVGGGHTPRWSADGSTLTYVRALSAGNPVAMARVSVATAAGGGSLAFGPPEDLFPYAYFARAIGQWWFDMTPDAERFLMITGANVALAGSTQVELVVVQNWFEELRRLVPTN